MKNLKNIGILFLAIISLMSCTKDDEEIIASANSSNVEPVNGKLFSADEVQNPIVFRWTPVLPKPQSVTYRLKVWQLMQGQNGTQAMRTNQPIVTKDVDNITEVSIQGIYTGPCRPPYLCDFVWTVQAVDTKGTPIGSNEGFSNSTVFSF